MAEEEAKKSESPSQPEPPPAQDKQKEDEKAEPPPNGVATQHTVPVQNVEDPAAKKGAEASVDRDSVFARVEEEKRLALIKAWEESEKTKADNKAYKKLSAVGLWENTKKASVEAQLKKIEEKLERKKAEYLEKMNNKIAEIHQSAEGKRAVVEAQRKEEFLKVEDTATKYRSSGYNPRKLLACFGA